MPDSFSLAARAATSTLRLSCGVVASSFRILRQVLSRLEDEVTGKIRPQELYVEIPAQRVAQAKRTAEVLGDEVYAKFPMVDGMKPHQ